LVVLVIVAQTIDPFQDPETWVLIWSLGLLFFVWWACYFVFYYAGLRRSDKKIHLVSSFAYKVSLLIALYLLSNILFLMFEFRSLVNGGIILLIFISLYLFLFHRPDPQQSTSIDTIVKKEEKGKKRQKKEEDEELRIKNKE
jgi:hypothetical protein